MVKDGVLKCMAIFILAAVIADIALFFLLSEAFFPEISLGDTDAVCREAFVTPVWGCYSHDSHNGYAMFPSFLIGLHEHMHHLGFDETGAYAAMLLYGVAITLFICNYVTESTTVRRWFK